MYGEFFAKQKQKHYIKEMKIFTIDRWILRDWCEKWEWFAVVEPVIIIVVVIVVVVIIIITIFVIFTGQSFAMVR